MSTGQRGASEQQNQDRQCGNNAEILRQQIDDAVDL
jgi:hypothetical protein